MRWKFEREDIAANKCFGCVHVRTGTLLLGLLNFLGHVAGLTLFIIALACPNLVENLLPSESPSLPSPPANEPPALLSTSNESIASFKYDAKYENLQNWLYVKNWSFEGLISGLLLTITSMVITLCLLYGTIRGVAKYITPYFCIQMFDLCLCGLTMLSYFSDLPAVRRWISIQSNLPFKQQLLALDNDHLTLLTLIIFVVVLSVKTYFIGVVWSCYKYLKQHENSTVLNRMRLYDSDELMNSGDDREMLLPPKYEDVLLMPGEQNGPPPPAYTPQ